MTTDTPSSRDEEIPLITAARNMDWQQVVLNGGPPCFHLCEDGRFCGRAQLWVGHDINHKFISLDDLLIRLFAEREKERETFVAAIDLLNAEVEHERTQKNLRHKAYLEQTATVAERDNQLAEAKATWDEFINCNPNSPFATIEKLKAQLIAAQTVNGKMREALKRVDDLIIRRNESGIERFWDDLNGVKSFAKEALALSPDPTLLDEVKRDSDRLDFLGELIGRCPDLEIYWNDDDCTEDADGMRPLGFTMRLQSVCAELLKASGNSFRECIDAFQARLRRRNEDCDPMESMIEEWHNKNQPKPARETEREGL